MWVLTFLLLYGSEAIKVSDKKCFRYSECNYLNAFCSCNWAAMTWPPDCSCACHARADFVEVDIETPVILRGESYDSQCMFESACAKYERENGRCGRHANCFEIAIGQPECKCEPGYEDHEHDVGCRRVNPCNDYDCSGIENSQCFVRNGEPMCVCGNNYEPHENDGDGGIYSRRSSHYFENTASVVCIPTVLCHDDVDCGLNKECHEMKERNGLPQAFCLCADGYTDGNDINDQVLLEDTDSLTCGNLDECSNPNLNLCHRSEYCSDTVGSYTCTCREGYREATGLLQTDSAPCDVENMCVAMPHYCAQYGQLCVDNPNDETGDFECVKCRFGSVPSVFGEDCECEEGTSEIGKHCVNIPTIDTCDFEDSVVKCHPEQMTIHLPTCAFTDGELDLSEIHLAGPDLHEAVSSPRCRPTFDATGDVVTFVIAGDLETCNNQFTDNGTHMLYENSVQYVDTEIEGVIFRSRQLKIDFACEFAKDVLVSLDRPITTISQHLQLEMPEIDVPVTIAINAYVDSLYMNQITTNSIIQVPQPIYVRLTIDIATANFFLQMKRCWATPGANPNDANSYTFINDYCGDSQEVNDGNLEVISNGVTNQAAFQLASFTFNDVESNDIYLHCATRLCDDSIEQCQVSCARRRRRNVLRFTTEHDSANVYTMTSGPIRIINP